ncbi:MarR family transcriptional regulator, partial [Mycobacterium sp. ITM-2017-0098]
VRRLEDAGMVTRTTDPTDARAVRIRITPEGVAALRQARLDRGAAVDPYLERLSDAEREVLTKAVDVMRRLIEDAGIPLPSSTAR